MSDQISRKRKNSADEMPLSFDEVSSIIQSGDSVKLNEVIKERRIDDINTIDRYTYQGQTLLSIACLGLLVAQKH